jgi:predicted phosphohydrolase
MSLYAIGDLHLSLGTDKPMDVFGGGWDNYVEKIKEGFGRLDASDTCVICGDVSWGMSLEESLPDFRFIEALPGRKLILKGNHDYWWTTASKIKSFFAANGISSVDILFNNCFFYGDTAICGTRGWFYEAHTGTEHDKKIMAREIIRLEASLRAAGGAPAAPEKLCFFHYPPVFKEYLSTGIIDMMNRYGVASCWYGHIHGQGRRWAVTGEREGIVYHMVSADHVDFTPVKVR